LPAIELDDESVIRADEIGDKFTERYLATELEPAQPATTQPRPQAFLDLGLIGTKATRCGTGHGRA
jgi:hypothetical protein